MKHLLDRLREPSSYAAIAAMLALIGVNLDQAVWQYLVGAATAIAGAAGVLLREASS